MPEHSAVRCAEFLGFVVIDEGGRVEPHIERFLKELAMRDRSAYTIRGYARDVLPSRPAGSARGLTAS